MMRNASRVMANMLPVSRTAAAALPVTGAATGQRDETVAAITEWAGAHDVPIVDLKAAVADQVMNGHGNPDGIHPNNAGYHAMAGCVRHTTEDAIGYGLTGPLLRACGVPYDIRKAEPYDIYNEIDFKVQYMKTGDCFARSYVPLLDMQESCYIIEQLLDKMPASGLD